jgi:hypothetical protein
MVNMTAIRLLLPDRLRRCTERLDALGERNLGLGLPLRVVVAVPTREEGLAEPRECTLALDEVGGVPVEALGRLRLALSLAPQLPLLRGELLLPRLDGALAGLELR